MKVIHGLTVKGYVSFFASLCAPIYKTDGRFEAMTCFRFMFYVFRNVKVGSKVSFSSPRPDFVGCLTFARATCFPLAKPLIPHF